MAYNLGFKVLGFWVCLCLPISSQRAPPTFPLAPPDAMSVAIESTPNPERPELGFTDYGLGFRV
jgi:hypothetical protein